MNKLTISVLVSIALLPIGVQASDFDDITLQIMDADTISHNVNSIDFTSPEVNMPEDNLANISVPNDAMATSIMTDSFEGAVMFPIEIEEGIGGELPGEILRDLPPNVAGEDIFIDPTDFPEDPDDIAVSKDIGGDLPGDVPSDIPEDFPNDIPTTDFPGELPLDNDG